MPLRLNEREREVLNWVAQGKTAWEIGTILGISPRTVEWHITQAKRKVGVANTIQTVVWAVRCGVIGTIFSGTGVSAYAARYGAWMAGVMDLIGGTGGSI